ncbi:MAG: glycosyltransferase [Candidatus Nanoarchaeia archaeon]|nr:glycosyltransferase [Candidatus Nanoarchaeia archaeon]
MKISAVIPTYNNEKDIGECIESLLNQTRKFHEIIVVDSSSRDKTQEIVKSYKKIRLITAGRGRSLARNLGWIKSKGDIVAFIESDSVFDKDWLKHIAESFEKGADAVIDRRQVYKPETFISRMNNEIFSMRMKKENYKPFSAWVFKREVLEKTKGFDNHLEAAEDVDLGTRTKQEGFVIVYQPSSVQYHKGEPKNLKELFKREWWFGKNMKNYYEKYPEKFPLVRGMGLFSLPLIFVFNWTLGFLMLLAYLIFAFVKPFRKGLKFKYASANALLSLPRNYIYFISLISSYF